MSNISPPIAIITPEDHGGLILIANGFGLCLVLIFMIVRVFARLFISPPFGRDDLLLGIATVSTALCTPLKTCPDVNCVTGAEHCLFGACVLHGI